MFDDAEFSDLAKSDQMKWVSLVLNLFSDVLAVSTQIEDAARHNLLELKEQASIDRKQLETDIDDESFDQRLIETPFGRGRIVRIRNDCYAAPAGVEGIKVAMNIVELDFGATLYQPIQGSLSKTANRDTAQSVSNGIPSEVNGTFASSDTRMPACSIVTNFSSHCLVPDAYWVHVVPTIKIRCVAAYCLQESLVAVLDNLVPLSSKDDVATLFNALCQSRQIAASAVRDEDISMAFQEALLKDWGDGIQMPNEATETTARLSLLHGSAIFFLAQEAGATKAVLHLLSVLFLSTDATDGDWNRFDFAEPHLISVMGEVLQKFLVSEEKEGYLIDPNVWRNASESGGKVALYCTSFAAVTVDILKIIRSMQPDQFEKYKHEFFPAICALVRVQSEEIRQIVQDILALQVAPFLGVKITPQLRRRSSTNK